MIDKRWFIFILLGIFLLSFTSALTQDAQSYYNLDEASGTTAYDSVKVYNGTVNGTMARVTGKINNAYSFNGATNYVNLTAPTSHNYTYTAWIYRNVMPSSGQYEAVWSAGLQGYDFWFGLKSDGSLRVHLNGASYTADTTTGIITTGQWYFIVVNGTNNTNATIYVNNVSIAVTTSGIPLTNEGSPIMLGRHSNVSKTDFPNKWNGTIDEVGIWNRTLTRSEMTELYNNGNGLSYGGSIPATITLISPVNATTISDLGTNFTIQGSNLSTLNGTWKNITYYVWKNGSLVNQTTSTLDINQTFNKTLFIDDFTRGNYEWNAKACYNNSTSSYCVLASNNNTFTVSLYTLVSEGYVNETVSGTLETFNVSIQLLEGFELTGANFYYDGEIRIPEIVAEENNRFVIVSDYQIPLISEDVNNSFFWELEFNNNETMNTTNQTQLVRAVFLDNCSSYTNRIFNLSLYNEQNQSSIIGDIELIYNILNRNYEVIKTYNFSADSISSTYICSALNLTEEDLYYSSEIRYVSDGYVPELYHIQRAEIGQEAQQINLYDLNSSSSTEFKITYQDSTFKFVEGAIVQLQRKYISEDSFKVVEAPITSLDGTTLLHIDLDSVKYRATVVKDGVVLDEFDNLVFKCQSELTGECEQKLLGEIDPQNDIDLEDTLDFHYSEPVLTNDTIIISFSVPSGAPSSVNILLEQKDQFANKTLCNRTITSSAGSISCTYSETLGDSYIDLTLLKNGNPMAKKSYVIHPETGLDWLGNNFIFIFVILLSLVGMALSSPEWIIINGIVTMVIAGGLYLARGLDFVMGLGSIMWLIIAAVILIAKISKQEDR